MNYNKPQVNVPNENEVTPYGTFAWSETVVAGIAVAIVTIALTAIDITP